MTFADYLENYLYVVYSGKCYTVLFKSTSVFFHYLSEYTSRAWEKEER